MRPRNEETQIHDAAEYPPFPYFALYQDAVVATGQQVAIIAGPHMMMMMMRSSWFHSWKTVGDGV